MTERFYREDGCVAVLVSHGFGAGWSSWVSGDNSPFDPGLVRLVLDGASDADMLAYCEERWPGEYFGGLDGLRVHWVSPGTQFRIHEYDGAESLILMEEDDYHIA